MTTQTTEDPSVSLGDVADFKINADGGLSYSTKAQPDTFSPALIKDFLPLHGDVATSGNTRGATLLTELAKHLYSATLDSVGGSKG